MPASWKYADGLSATIDRLRAELAAEKEDVWKMRDVGLRAITGAIATEKERCAKIAENFRESWPYGRLIAAAIRASNAAPLESLPGGLARHWLSEGGTSAPNAAPPQPSGRECDFCGAWMITPCPDRATANTYCGFGRNPPPHVEPSAAESDVSAINTGNTKMAQTVDEIMNEHVVECKADQPMAMLISEIRRYRVTEARMLELARETLWSTNDASAQLAALVIETFGVKK